MTALIRNPVGDLKDVADVQVRDSAGALKPVEEMWIRTAAGLRQFFGSFAVSVDRESVRGVINSGGTQGVETQSVTASSSGAVGGVSYLWTQVSGDAGWTITNPASATTKFANTVGPSESKEGVFKCAVSDGAGHSADSPNVSAQVVNRYFELGGTL